MTMIRDTSMILATASIPRLANMVGVFVVMLAIVAVPSITSAIQVDNTNEIDCVDLRMIIVFEDRPDDMTINLHTAATANDDEVQYYWENYLPYSQAKNLAATTLFEEICVPKDACYLLQVVDNGKITGWDDRATNTTTTATAATNSSPYRAFSISFDHNMIGVYDSNSEVDSCFSVIWYQFGYSCVDDDETEEEDENDSDKKDEKKENTNDTIESSSMVSIFRGSIPCQNTKNDGTTGSTTSSLADEDETIVQGNNETLPFAGPAITEVPTIAPISQSIQEQSDTPSVSSQASIVPTLQPSSSTTPSVAPISQQRQEQSDTPSVSSAPSIVPTIRPSSSTPPSFAPMSQQKNEQSDTPSVSSQRSIVPTLQPSSVTLPSFAPISQQIEDQSDTPSVSSAKSIVPTIRPSVSTIPSIVPVASNTPIAPDNIRPAITIPPIFASSDVPSSILSSSTVPSDTPSNFPSMVPTANCIQFFMIVQLDDHPEDMILTLTSTNEHGSDDDVVMWDKIRPWRNDDGRNTTFTANQIVNQTTCVFSEGCYTLTVEDDGNDGLTSGSDETESSMSGYFTLSYDTDRIISYYDGARDGCYRRKVYKFGMSMNCAMTETTEPNDRSCPQVRRRR